MLLQQPELPKEQPATETQQWGFTIWEFIVANKWYLLLILLLIFIVWFANKSRRKL